MKKLNHVGLFGNFTACEKNLIPALNQNALLSDSLIQISAIAFVHSLPLGVNEGDVYILVSDEGSFTKHSVMVSKGNDLWIEVKPEVGFLAGVRAGGSIYSPDSELFWYNGFHWAKLYMVPADVSGPSSALDHSLARFDGTTGKWITDSGVILDNANNMSGIQTLTAQDIYAGDLYGGDAHLVNLDTVFINTTAFTAASGFIDSVHSTLIDTTSLNADTGSIDELHSVDIYAGSIDVQDIYAGSILAVDIESVSAAIDHVSMIDLYGDEAYISHVEFIDLFSKTLNAANSVVTESPAKTVKLLSYHNTVLSPISEIDTFDRPSANSFSSAYTIENKSGADILIKKNALIITGQTSDYLFKDGTTIFVIYSNETSTFNLIAGGGGGSGSGIITVADLTARDAIAAGDRTEGETLVYVTSEKKTYQLVGGITNGDWVMLPSAPYYNVANALNYFDSIPIKLDEYEQTWLVSGDTEHITLDAQEPFGDTAPMAGAEITLIGESDDKSVTIPSGVLSTSVMGYSVTLGRGHSVTYKYDATLNRYIIKSVSN